MLLLLLCCYCLRSKGEGEEFCFCPCGGVYLKGPISFRGKTRGYFVICDIVVVVVVGRIVSLWMLGSSKPRRCRNIPQREERDGEETRFVGMAEGDRRIIWMDAFWMSCVCRVRRATHRCCQNE